MTTRKCHQAAKRDRFAYRVTRLRKLIKRALRDIEAQGGMVALERAAISQLVT